MDTYARFRPTEFDSAGAFLPDRQEWLVVPVTRTRDSGPLAESNFETAEKMLQAADTGEDYENHRFGHWGPGWFEVLIVRPGSTCATVAQDIEHRLEGYPVLNEDDYSEREWDAATDTWQHGYSLRERVELIQEHNRHIQPQYRVSVFAARGDCIPQGDSGYIFDRCRPEE